MVRRVGGKWGGGGELGEMGRGVGGNGGGELGEMREGNWGKWGRGVGGNEGGEFGGNGEGSWGKWGVGGRGVNTVLGKRHWLCLSVVICSRLSAKLCTSLQLTATTAVSVAVLVENESNHSKAVRRCGKERGGGGWGGVRKEEGNLCLSMSYCHSNWPLEVSFYFVVC